MNVLQNGFCNHERLLVRVFCVRLSAAYFKKQKVQVLIICQKRDVSSEYTLFAYKLCSTT